MLEKTHEIELPHGKYLRGIQTSQQDHVNELVICIAGFAREALREPKFQFVAEKIENPNTGVFRYDFPGLGLSEGDFSNITIEKSADDVKRIIDYFRKNFRIEVFHLLAHSLGAAIISQSLSGLSTAPERIAVIAPALNQRELQRYWFTRKKFKNERKNITWSNYQELFDEESFQKDIHTPEKVVAGHKISSKYFIESSGQDYTPALTYSTIPICHIHGSQDSIVPPESVSYITSNRTIVKGGDHELEKDFEKRKWLRRVQRHFWL